MPNIHLLFGGRKIIIYNKRKEKKLSHITIKLRMQIVIPLAKIDLFHNPQEFSV